MLAGGSFHLLITFVNMKSAAKRRGRIGQRPRSRGKRRKSMLILKTEPSWVASGW